MHLTPDQTRPHHPLLLENANQEVGYVILFFLISFFCFIECLLHFLSTLHNNPTLLGEHQQYHKVG